MEVPTGEGFASWGVLRVQKYLLREGHASVNDRAAPMFSKEWFDERRRRPDVYEFAALAQYNSERFRGIVHTEEYRALMAQEQERFNAQKEAEILTSGGLIVRP